MKSVFILLVCLGILGYIGYYAYMNWLEGDNNFKTERRLSEALISVREGLSDKVSEVSDEYIETPVQNKIEEGKQAVADSLKNSVGGLIEKLGDRVIAFGSGLKPDSQKNTMTDTGLNDSSPDKEEAQFRTSLVSKSGIPFRLMLNSPLATSSYVINWGDGVSDFGSILPGLTRELSHSWTQKGSYLITVSSTENGLNFTDSLFIKIEE